MAVHWEVGSFSPKRSIALLASLYLIFLVLSLRFIHVNIDDIYVSFRYAVNLANGHGLSFNPGQRVEGFSNPLWVLLLSMLFRLFGLTHTSLPNIAGMTALAKSLGFLFGIVTITCAWTFVGNAFRLGPMGRFFAVLPLVLSTDFAFCSTNGLETGLVIVLELLFVSHLVSIGFQRDRGRPHYIVMLAAAGLVLVRVDGFLIVAIWGAVWIVLTWYRHRATWSTVLRNVFVLFGPACALFAVYLLFRRAYFGDWVSNTFHIKFPTFYPWQVVRIYDYFNPRPTAMPVWLHFVTTIKWYVIPATWGWIALWFLLLDGAFLVRKGAIARAFDKLAEHSEQVHATPVSMLALGGIASSLLALYAAWVGGDWMPGHRLLVPALVPTTIMITACSVRLIALLHSSNRSHSVGIGVLASALVAGTYYSSDRHDAYTYKDITQNELGHTVDSSVSFFALRNDRPTIDTLLAYVGFVSYLKNQTAKDDVIAIYESGFASLYLGEDIRTLDLSGLHDRVLSRRMHDEGYTWLMQRFYTNCGGVKNFKDEYVLSVRPHYVVFDTFMLKWCRTMPSRILDGNYRLVQGLPGNSTGFFSVYERAQETSSSPP